MKELLTYIARNLVDHPDAVHVTEHAGDGETVLELRVDPEDMGKVIGRQGLLAKEIRHADPLGGSAPRAPGSLWRSSIDSGGTRSS